MPKLIINRSSEWNNKFRAINIYLNNKKIGEINNGETKTFDIETGEHEVKTTIDWCGSNQVKFTLNHEEEVKQLGLCGFKFGRWLIPSSLLLSLLYFVFEPHNSIYSILFTIPVLAVFCYLVYKLSLGRNQYLILSDIE
jgi:hypothetical protein